MVQLSWLSGWYQGGIRVVSGWYQDVIGVVYECYQGGIRVYQGGIRVVSVRVVSWWYRLGIKRGGPARWYVGSQTLLLPPTPLWVQSHICDAPHKYLCET